MPPPPPMPPPSPMPPPPPMPPQLHAFLDALQVRRLPDALCRSRLRPHHFCLRPHPDRMAKEAFHPNEARLSQRTRQARDGRGASQQCRAQAASRLGDRAADLTSKASTRTLSCHILGSPRTGPPPRTPSVAFRLARHHGRPGVLLHEFGGDERGADHLRPEPQPGEARASAPLYGTHNRALSVRCDLLVF